jgi:hypothetical protein
MGWVTFATLKRMTMGWPSLAIVTCATFLMLEVTMVPSAVRMRIVGAGATFTA